MDVFKKPEEDYLKKEKYLQNHGVDRLSKTADQEPKFKKARNNHKSVPAQTNGGNDRPKNKTLRDYWAPETAEYKILVQLNDGLNTIDFDKVDTSCKEQLENGRDAFDDDKGRCLIYLLAGSRIGQHADALREFLSGVAEATTESAICRQVVSNLAFYIRQNMQTEEKQLMSGIPADKAATIRAAALATNEGTLLQDKATENKGAGGVVERPLNTLGQVPSR